MYVDLVWWDALAQSCAQHLTKGRLIAFAGRLDLPRVEDHDGDPRSKHEIVADEIELDEIERPASREL